MYGAGGGAPAPAPKPAALSAPPPVKTVVSQPALVIQTTVTSTPTHSEVKTHTAITDQIKAGEAPALKHAEVTRDASAPKVEAVTIKSNPHPAVMTEIAKPPALKHTEVAHDASKPAIPAEVKVQKHDRPNLFNEIKASANPAAGSSGGSDVIKTLEDSLRGAENSLKMIDATKKTVASNEKNLEDSKNNAHGCDPIPEAEKKLASSKDLLQAHVEGATRKVKTAAYCYENAKRVAPESVKERYAKLQATAKIHGL